MVDNSTSSKRARANGSDGDTGNATKRQAVRKRAPLACEECRTRKRKCDGVVPICGGCTKRMSSCVYMAEVQEKAWQHGMIESLRQRLKELEQGTAAEQDEPQPDRGPDPDGTNDRDIHGLHCVEQAVQDNMIGSQRSDKAHISPVTAAHQNQQLAQDTERDSGATNPHRSYANDLVNSGDQRPLADMATTMQAPAQVTWLGPRTTFRSPSGVSGHLEPSSVERLMKPIDQEINQTLNVAGTDGGTAINGSASMSTTVTTPCTCDHLLHANARQWSLPLRRQADELVRLYFTRVHRTYPILHQPTFIRQYNLLWEPASAGPNISSRSAVCSGLCRQKSLDKVFPAMVNAVFALASLFASSSPEENSIRAAAFFKVTQQVDLLDVIDEEVGIELVQLLLLMGFYLQSTERFSKCWNMTGLAIRMAQNMGLQLSSQDARKKGLLASSPTQLESEMRIRVWYGCVLLDREISMSFGRPLMINNTAGGDYLKLPQAIDDEYLNEEAGGEWNLQPRDCPSLLESYIQTIKLYDILGRVLDREETKHATTATTATPSLARLSQLDTPPDMGLDTQSLLDLDNMIMEWLDALPSHLRYEPTSELARDNRALTPESIPLTHTHFSAQAKRLYARFLHVRVLILRPALEHLFHKQRHAQSDAPARPNKSVSRVQDLMLSDIAAQCVLSADSLVRCLDTYIRAKSLVAWWYNISYLHTCGSTLLMGRLCNFTGATVKQESLSATWEVCLRCISQYTGLSSIASKSFHLLKESARRLLPQPASDKAINQGLVSISQGVSRTHAQLSTIPRYHRAVTAGVDNAAITEGIENWPTEEMINVMPASSQELGGSLMQEPFTAEIWDDNDPSGTSYWPFMPFLSQLESMPPDFGLPNLE